MDGKVDGREQVTARHNMGEETLSDWATTVPETTRQIWARRAAQLAHVPVEQEEGAWLDLVLVRLGREVYGFEARHVLDIRPVGFVTLVPRVPEWVVGVTNVRGRLWSVMDLERFFDLPLGAGGFYGGLGLLVLVEAEQMELALQVDDVLAVERVPATQIQKPDGTIPGLHPAYVRGVIKDVRMAEKEEMAIVLDLPALLADEKLIVDERLV
jgi:purine-binding chemotaxis protein CheW